MQKQTALRFLQTSQRLSTASLMKPCSRMLFLFRMQIMLLQMQIILSLLLLTLALSGLLTLEKIRLGQIKQILLLMIHAGHLFLKVFHLQMFHYQKKTVLQTLHTFLWTIWAIFLKLLPLNQLFMMPLFLL